MQDFNQQPNIQGPITTADSAASGRLKVDVNQKKRMSKNKRKIMKKAMGIEAENKKETIKEKGVEEPIFSKYKNLKK